MAVKGLIVLRWRLRGCCPEQAVTEAINNSALVVLVIVQNNMQPAEANSNSLVLEFVIVIIIITLI